MVNFRWETKTRADQVGVSGWVKNTPEGKVEAEFQGDETSVNQMIDYVKTGPPAANVNDIKVEELPTDESLIEFEVRSTY